MIYQYDSDLDEWINFQILSITKPALNNPNLTKREVEIYLGSRGIAFNNLGLVYVSNGRYKEALEFFQNSLLISDYFDDDAKRANAYNNIGMIYDHMKLPEKALDYFNKSYTLDSSDAYSKGTYYNNSGLCYFALGDTNKALGNYKLSLKNSELAEDYRGLGNTYSNIALILYNKKLFNESLQNYDSAIAAYQKVGLDDGIALAYNGKGDVYLDQSQFQLARANCETGYNLAKESGSLSGLKANCNCLYFVHKNTGNVEKALEFHELYVGYRDSLEKTEKKQEVLKLDFQFNLNQQKSQDSIEFAHQQKMERISYETSLERKQNFQYFLFAGIGVCVIVGLLLLRGFLQKKRDHEIIAQQKKEVELQKHIVEEKNKEITDSINYAKRIQEAILPGESLLKHALPDNFVYYKPKDIVAGDFYWLEEKENLILFAVADCTGHGVPGAMVSVVCHNALNRSVNEFNLTDPGKILDKTRELVIETFENESASEFKKHSTTVVTTWTFHCVCWTNQKSCFIGANNHLYLIRDNQLSELTADKQPVGKMRMKNHLKPLPSIRNQ
ncbi:MAG: tetratricopeptide repeat protein [Crocinitomicaceae bacterium]|nr:tetratricopeptide repeat protein [Crocinitomicaceae bacterium]